MSRLSPRLRVFVDALPLRPGLRVLEIGGGPGAAARAVVERVAPDGFVLMIDRSATAIEQARRACAVELAAGLLELRQVAVEDFALAAGDEPFDLAFASRVGALDGRHADLEHRARQRVWTALRDGARFVVDGTDQTPPH